jgi:hypothetical protein
VKELALELRPAESRHYASWEDRLASVARHARPDELHALLEQAHAIGARAVLAVFDDPIREALLAFQRWRDVACWAVLPNMFSFIRDLTDLGMLGAAAARFRRLGPLDMFRVGGAALLRADRVLRRDFATGAMLVLEMELLALRALRVTRIALHPQLTELALAGGVRELFVELRRRAERTGCEAALVTHNPLRARELLGDELRRFAAVVAPCSPAGYKMFPSPASSLELMRSEPDRYLAAEPTAAGRVPVAQAIAHCRALALRGAVLEPAAVGDAFRQGLRF